MSTTFWSKKAADNFRLMRSRTFSAPDTGEYWIFQLPRYSFVRGSWVYISTALSGGSTLSIGFTGNGETADSDAFMTTVAADATSTGTKSSYAGKWFNSESGVVTVTVSQGGTAAGVFVVFVEYSIIH
jgi:hypothetical protein